MTRASLGHETTLRAALQEDEQGTGARPASRPTLLRACAKGDRCAPRLGHGLTLLARHKVPAPAKPSSTLVNRGRRQQPVAMRPSISPPPMRTTPPFVLRPILAEDSELAYAITREAMRDYVEQTWGPWIEADQRERHVQAFRSGTQDFIVVRDEVLGLRHIEWRQTHLYLARLYLRPAAQGRGLGSAVLRDLQQQARAIGRSIELQVLKVNTGAQRFYARHGFQQVDERERYWLLRGV